MEAASITKGISVTQASFRAKMMTGIGMCVTATFLGLVVKNQAWPFIRAKMYKPVL